MRAAALVLGTFLSISSYGGISAAQESFPARPIRIVVASAPGSTGEVIGRQIADSLTKRLGQPVVIDIRPGAGGAIGTTAVANSKPDGYTLLFVSSSILVNQAVKPDQLDIRTGLTALTPTIFGIMGIFINPTIPANTLAEFVAYAKERPGKLRYGSSGNGTVTHLYGVIFNQAAGLKMTHVPYTGGAPSIIGAMANDVQMLVIDTFTAKSQADAGTLKLLGVATKERLPSLPAVPTVIEGGVAGFEANFWYGFFAPPGMPKPLADRLTNEINAVLQEPDVRKRLVEQGYEVRGMTSGDFAKLVEVELARWMRAVKDSESDTAN